VTATLEAPVARRPHAPLRISRGPALFVIWAGAAAVLALWWKDTTFVIGLDRWLTNAGRITGLLAGYLVVVLLALMARVPALERGVGTDQLARWHAMIGRYTVSLAVAHTLLIIWGYSVTAHTNVVHETGGLLTSYPDVLMATVATGLLVAVGVASARAARRRLLWAAMYIAVASLLVWFRMARPVAQGLRHRMRVVEVRRESPDTVSVWLTGRHLDELGAEPGQFFRWRFLARGMWWAANPFSLSAPPRPDLLRITVKAAGDHSRALAAVRPGTPVLAEGPFGAFTAARRRQRHVLLLAGGVGITPLRALSSRCPASRVRSH
jgi:predicted ferric reductase